MSAIAERQGGAISRAQLRAAGLADGAIEHRVRRGRLHPVYRGVYAVGHPRLTSRGRLWAAVLACGGPGAAVLSHRSAAAVWDLLPTPARFDVTTLRSGHARDGLRVHRSRTLTPADLTTQHDGLPLTTPSRTLLDLAGGLTPHRLERVVHRAQHLRLLDVTRLQGAPPALRHALATLATHDPDITRSELEERFLALVLDAQLPRPEVNATAAGHEVDFLWHDHRLIAETDGAATHLTRPAFEHDRRRDAELQALGYRVVRFSYRQVTEAPVTVARTLGALLRTPPRPRRAPSARP